MRESQSATLKSLYEGACELCPRICGARRSKGERGACGAADEMLVARAALHFWEEPPISGERGSGTVFFAHCPLHCVYCQNSDLAFGRAGKAVSEERLAEICLELQAQGALNVNFVTPTHYSASIARSVERAREQGLSLPIVWNTSGYERVETIKALSQTVDVYLADFKYSDSDLAAKYSHAPDYPHVALSAIEQMVESTGTPRLENAKENPRLISGVVVRHMLLPGALEQSKTALRMLFGRFGNSVLYSIMNQYTPVMNAVQLERYPELACAVPTSEYEELLDFADTIGMEDYYWQDGEPAQESFIPAWDYTGIE